VKVFLDTNVLASAFGTRGLCADVFRLILVEHELMTAEVVIEELCRVLDRKFTVPSGIVRDIENFLRGYHVEPRPRRLLALDLRERADTIVITSALNAGAETLITGDREMLVLKQKPEGLRVLSPRDFWNLATGTSGKPRRKP
jgi:uncharacterized protein